jgi:hypothetical protein
MKSFVLIEADASRQKVDGNGSCAKYGLAVEARNCGTAGGCGFGLFSKKAHECHTALTYRSQPFRFAEANTPLSVFLQVQVSRFRPLDRPPLWHRDCSVVDINDTLQKTNSMANPAMIVSRSS